MHDLATNGNKENDKAGNMRAGGCCVDGRSLNPLVNTDVTGALFQSLKVVSARHDNLSIF